MNAFVRFGLCGMGLGVVLAADVAESADFTWLDASASANWNETDANWSGAGAVWSSAKSNSAVFSSSVSTVKNITAGSLTLSNLTFTADGYTIGGGPLSPYGFISVATNVTVGLTASIVHAETNLVLNKFGPGTVVLNPGGGSGSNIFASLKVAQGTMRISGGTNVVTLSNTNPEANPPLWVSGGTMVVAGGLLKSTCNKYARVSDYGTLLVTNGYVDLTSFSELLNAHNSPGNTTVAGGGTLEVLTLRISQCTTAAANNVVNVNTGGVIKLNNFGIDPSNGPKGTVNFNGGTVVARTSYTDFLGGSTNKWIQGIICKVLEGGAVFDSGSYGITIKQPLVSGATVDGGLAKKGAGSLSLRGTNTYNGGNSIFAGTLNVVDDNNLGAVPSVPTTNVLFLSRSTLQSGASHALSANRTLWITNNVWGIFDTQSYTQTVYGVITCAETNSVFVKDGLGMLVLDPGSSNVNRFGTLQVTNGTLVIASGTNLVTAPNNGQNAPGLRVCGGTLLMAGGVLKTTALMFVNVDGGTLLVTNGVVDATSCNELLNSIGGNGFGYTTVRDSGVIVAQRIRLSQNSTGYTNSIVTVSTGGVLRTTGFYIDITAGQKGMLVLNGGTVEARTSTADFLGTTTVYTGGNNDKWLLNILARVREGGAIFNTAGYDISIKQPLLADVAVDGGLIKRGAGSLTLLNTNSYSGVTSVEAGTLKLGTTNALWTTGSASVSSGAVFDVNGVVQSLAGLGGSGTVTNNASLSVAGTVAPGGTNAVGTLLLATPCPLSGTFRATVSIAGNCGQLRVNGNLDLSGLALSVANSGALNKDKRYVIATYTGSLVGGFSSATLPYRWIVRYDTVGRQVYLTYNFGTLLSLL